MFFSLTITGPISPACAVVCFIEMVRVNPVLGVVAVAGLIWACIGKPKNTTMGRSIKQIRFMLLHKS